MKVYRSDYLEQYTAKAPDKQRFERLRSVPFFDIFKHDDELGRLVKTGCWYQCPAGTIIIREGDSGSELYVLISGKIRVFKAGKTLAILTPGEVVGEMGSLLAQDRCANVVALEESTLFRLDIEAMRNFPREQLFSMMRYIYGVTAKRLVDADRRLAAV
jgi:CRP-like cAMP-binding protein